MGGLIFLIGGAMTSTASAEVRWIVEGTVPTAAWEWFVRNKLANGPDKRGDHYTVLPGVQTVGVKWRDEKLEFKPRAKDLGVKDCGRQVQGRIELWEKWSWSGNAVEDVKRAADSMPERWIAVEKSRIERKFAFDGKAVREIDAKKKYPGNACNVEVTALRVGGQDYWTFGLEAFADPESNEKSLELTLTAVLNETATPAELLGKLTAAVTRSYPTWLATLKSH